MSRATKQQAASHKQRASGKKQQAAKAGNKLIAACAGVLAAATIALYSPVLGHGFVIWDDREYITSNSHIHEGLSWNTIKWAFTSTEAANWHPLTWISHALDYQFFALNATGHHLDSLLLHALNVALLFLLLTWLTRRTGPSLLVAALFAVHPLNVESVAWVAERKNVLSTLFFLLAIGAYAWYARKPDWRRYVLVAGLFAAGLMAKPMVITLPFVLLLLDYWPLERFQSPVASRQSPVANQQPFWKLAREKVPLLLLSAASAWITLKAQQKATRTFAEFPLAVRIENAVVAYVAYLAKMLWPARLAARYPHPGSALPAWQIVLSGLILLGVSALALVYRRRRYLPVGWFWFLGTLVPVIGLVQVGGAAMADRYAYVPLIGIFVMIAWGLSDWAETKNVPRFWRVAPAGIVLVALAVVAFRQISYWESEYALWARTLAVTKPEQSAFAHYALARTLMDPGSGMTEQDLENYASDQERVNDARRHYEESASLVRHQPAQQHPDDLVILNLALNSLGMLDEQQNQPEGARRYFEEALQSNRQLATQDPDLYRTGEARTLNNMAMLEARQDRPNDARRLFEEALKVCRQLAKQDPNEFLAGEAGTLHNLAVLDMKEQRVDDARRHYEEALEDYHRLAQRNPALYLAQEATMLHDLAILDGSQNRMEGARRHFEGALKAYRQLAQQDPNQYTPYVAGLLNNLGTLNKNQNRMDEARDYYQQALVLFQKLAQADSRFSGDAARVKANLEELGNNSSGK